MAETLWIGTRKGLFSLRALGGRRGWKLAGPQFLGHVIHHVVQDPREPRVLLLAARTGHLGPTVMRSADRGRTWCEAAAPPAFHKVAEGAADARAVQRVFWLTPGHSSERGSWYAGSSPAGLFHSADGGERWRSVDGFNEHPMRPQWAAQATPDGEFLHSILIDPRDPRHLYIAISIGGVFESTDAGETWAPLNEGCAADFLPDPDAAFGHDPHSVVLHPRMPDRLYQQNHCGIYRLDRPARRWQRIGTAMPRKVGDVGFPIVAHPTDPDCVWVLPMDGRTVWPRTSIDGRPAVYVTRDAGESWRRLDRGLPRSQAWFTVLRQGMCADQRTRPALYFGTTAGEIWAGSNGGESWRCLVRHLPEIYSVTCAA